MRTTLMFLLIFIFINHAHAQEYSGRLTDNKTGTPLEYASIGIIGTSIGTVSNEHGVFAISLPKEYEEDTLRVSHLGYEPFTMQLSDFKSQYDKQNIIIELQQKTEHIDEIIVRTTKASVKKLGNDFPPKRSWSSFGNGLGYEVATLMKLNNSPVFIDSAEISIIEHNYDSLICRVNIYEMNDTTIGKNIISQAYKLVVHKNEITDKIYLDISHLNLRVENDFLLSMEVLNESPSTSIKYVSKRRGEQSYVRFASEGYWERSNLKLGICCYVSSVK